MANLVKDLLLDDAELVIAALQYVGALSPQVCAEALHSSSPHRHTCPHQLMTRYTVGHDSAQAFEDFVSIGGGQLEVALSHSSRAVHFSDRVWF